MAAVPTQGTIVAISTDGGVVYTNLCQVTGFSGPSGTSDEIDITTLCSTAKDYLLGLPDSGELSMSAVWDPTDAGLTALKTLFDSRDEADFRITPPSPYNTNTISFSGRVSGWSLDVSANEAYRLGITVRITSAVTVA